MRPAFLGLLLAAFAWADALVVQHVTVIGGGAQFVQPDMAVVMERDRIVSVTPAKRAKVPKGAQIVDGSGKFLIPGLWDMHVHGTADASAPLSYLLDLANGVLGVREMAGPPDARAWRAHQAESDRPAPTVYLGSPMVDGPRPVWPTSIRVADAEQARAVVRQLSERGSDFIKIYSLLPPDAYFALAEEARRRGMPFAGHVPAAVRPAEASDAGQKTMEHLMGLAIACSSLEDELRAEARERGFTPRVRLKAFETYDDAKAQALFARFVKNGTWQCPTLTVVRAVGRINDPRFRDDARLKYVRPELKRGWSADLDPNTRNLTADDWAVEDKLVRESIRLAGRMHRAGVGILAGTDALTLYCFPGFSLHDELALLVEAGLSPREALQAATSNAAQSMGRLENTGTVEAGKLADLVLLDRDPMADIHNTTSIRAVILHGKLMPRPELDRMLSEAEELARR